MTASTDLEHEARLTRGRRMPSISCRLRGERIAIARCAQPFTKPLPAGSATHSRVCRPRYAGKRPMVAEVPPVPAPHTIHAGSDRVRALIC
jgi:hypothetical protein